MKSMFLAILFVLTALLGCVGTPALAPAVAPDTLIYADDDGVDIGSSRPFPGGEKLYQREEYGMRVKYHQGFGKLPKTWPPTARLIVMPDTSPWCAQELRLLTKGVADLKYDEVDLLPLVSLTPRDRGGMKEAIDPARWKAEGEAMDAENTKVREAEERARRATSKVEIKTLVAISGIGMEDPGFIKICSSESFPGCKEHAFSDRKLYDLEVKHSRAKLDSVLPLLDKSTARIMVAGNVPPSLLEEVQSVTGLDVLKYEEIKLVTWLRWDEREMTKCLVDKDRFTGDLARGGWSQEAVKQYMAEHFRVERCAPDEARRNPPSVPRVDSPKPPNGPAPK